MPDEPADGLLTVLDEVQDQLQQNRAAGEELEKTIRAGNAVARRKKTWIALTCVSVLLDVALTGALWRVQTRSTDIQGDLRVNTCNLNTLLAQSVTGSGSTADLYGGLRAILVADGSAESRKAIEFIDRATAGLKDNQKIRADFLTLTQRTAVDLHCPAGFTAR